MPQLTLTDEQVIELVRQLSGEQQTELFRFLLLQQWGEWHSLSTYGSEKVRLVAQERGQNWDAMTEDKREAFIDEIVHEN